MRYINLRLAYLLTYLPQHVSAPSGHTDFRPISVTPVLTRVMEKIVVRQFLYPSFITPPLNLTFSDQFAFRPTGSTVAALIYILHSHPASNNTSVCYRGRTRL